MTHTNWKQDILSERRVPKVGDRIFVDLTEARAREHAKEYVAKNWENAAYPMKGVIADTQGAAVEYFVKDWTKHGGGENATPDQILRNQSPDVFTVTAEWLEAFDPEANFNKYQPLA